MTKKNKPKYHAIACSPEVHEEVVKYSQKTKFDKKDIADTAIIEFFEKRGLNKKWTINKLHNIEA